MTPETEMGRRFGLYVVGVFDVLGQKRSLYQLPGARTHGVIQKDEVLNYLGDTVGRVLGVRTLFKNQFEQAVQTTEHIARSCGATALQKEVLTPSIRYWGMSDSYVVAIPPPDDQEFSTVSRLIDVYRMLDVAAAVWLLAMSRDLPIRGGIELGFAIDVGEHEVYGHALAEAHRLESRVAQFPRVVVGEKLIFLLNSAVDKAALRDAQEAHMANNLAGLCWKCLRTDEDGQLEVDIAGGGIAAQMREHMPEVLTAVARNVQQQLKRHEDAGDNKLMERYQRLQRSVAGLCEKADVH